MLKVGRALLITSFSLAAVLFASSASVRADNVVEGFYAKGSLKSGQIVRLSAKPAATVELAPATASNQIFGVVVDADKSPITLERLNQQVFVATGGNYPVLVSSENGAIKKGDIISISRSAGIGAKASSSQPVILGHADGSFDGTSNVLSRSAGQPVGKINVTISVAPNPLFKNTLAIPQPLQKIGNSIAGREVPPFRVYMALLMFVVATSLAVILLIIGVRSSITAIGRNPLSQQSILRGLFQVIGVSLGIFAISVGGVYLLLRL